MKCMVTIVILLTLCCNLSAEIQKTEWVEDSFADFADGVLDSSGENLYVSANGSVRSIHRYDINDDGYLDLFFGNTHDIISLVSPVEVTVSKGRQSSQRNLNVYGSNRVRMADFNRDGYPDLVLSLTHDGLQTGRRYLTIVYGGKDGWSNSRSNCYFTADSPKSLATPDLNADGWPDVAVDHWTTQLGSDVAKSGSNDRIYQKVIRVYWGGQNGFKPERFRDLPIESQPNATWLEAMDFDGDNTADLAVMGQDGEIRVYYANKGIETGKIKYKQVAAKLSGAAGFGAGDVFNSGKADLIAGTSNGKLYIFRNRGKQSWYRPDVIEGINASQITVCDLDKDNRADLVLASFVISRSAGMGEAVGAGENTPEEVTVLWGSDKGFSLAQSSKLAAKYGYATAAGDLDGDGMADIAIASYQGEKSFEGNSLIYFNMGSRKFQASQTMIKTAGATDVLIMPATEAAAGKAVFANSIGGSLYEQMPVYVYWGTQGGFDPNKRWDIPCQSGHQATAADLNADGYVDFVVMYTAHAGASVLKNPQLGANIFWGSDKGFDIDKRRTILKGIYSNTCKAADLNKDGYLDIVMGGWNKEGVHVYYGSANGFDPNNKEDLATNADSHSICIADFNRDNWLDIATSGMNDDLVHIFWGSPAGLKDVQLLSVPSSAGCQAADFNNDGYLDLYVSSYYDRVNNYFDSHNFIFWGSPEGFKVGNSQSLPGSATGFITAADFDNDGYVDIFCPNYLNQHNRENVASFLYWGGPDGFRWNNRTVFICDSASAAMAGDFDGDGKTDLAVACHTVYGDHHALSKVFYNDGNRFKSLRMQILPSDGVHFIWGSDIGNIYDRKHVQKYDSSMLKWSEVKTSGKLEFYADISTKSDLAFYIRSAENSDIIKTAEWRKLESNTFNVGEKDRCMQYRAEFRSKNGDRYPILDRVQIELQ